MRFFLFIFALYMVNVHSQNTTSQIVGQSLWEDLSDKNEEYIESFISGMVQGDSGLLPSSVSSVYDMWDELRDIKFKLEAKKNQILAKDFFESLTHSKQVIPLIEKKLYYRKINEGNGKTINGINDKMTCQFKIKNIYGEIINETQVSEENEVSVNDFIPGMSAGMMGMQEGEKREIFISPVYAYGDDASFPPQMVLISEVELIHVISHEISPIKFEPEPLPVKDILEPLDSIEQQHRELEKKIAFELGIKTWHHFKHGTNQGYALSEVIETLRQAQKGSLVDISGQEVQELLTQIHWNCYQTMVLNS